MKRVRFTEEQIIAVLREHEAGAKTADAGNHRWLDHDVRARAVVLLHCAHLSAARVRHLVRMDHNRQCGFCSDLQT